MDSAVRCIGAAALLFCSVIVIRGYRGFLARRRQECDELLLIMRGLRREVEHFLTPLCKIFAKFASDKSVPSGMASRIADGMLPEEAFLESRDRLAVGEDGKEILGDLFSGLGQGYKDGAVAHISSCEKRFDEYVRHIKDEYEKNGRLVAVLVLGAALGLVILFI